MAGENGNTKPKVAFFDFTSCEGCQLTVVDSLQKHLDLLNVVEIVNFREAISRRDEDYQIAFVEGSCSRPADEARLRKIRDQAALVVALGACAHLGGINAIRNRQPLQEVRRYVYGDRADWYDTYPARPIDQVIQVDAVIPGCPIDGEEFIRSVKMLLQGRIPKLPETPMCVECKLRGNVCLMVTGAPCLGPVTHAGCGALCPSYQRGCYGCFGPMETPNTASLARAFRAAGVSETDLVRVFRTFNAAAPAFRAESEAHER